VIPALMPTYNRADLAFERGEGAWLWTADGRRFLDFGAGIATASLGHGHPHLVRAIAEQAAKVMHTSNLYRIPQAERLAARLVETSFADSVFFCNSGAEANEGMLKAVRKFHAEEGRPERFATLCFEGAFHGRTLATLAATGNEKYLAGFGPPAQGFRHVPFGNMNAVRDAIDGTTAAVLVEPIQGEGGVRPASLQFLRDLRAACDEFGLLLALDEVQSGMGRSGKLWAHQWAGIEPDVMSSAKGIGGGFPLGAILAKERVAKHLKPGTHGSTYGGNPLACAAALAVLEAFEEEDLLARANVIGERVMGAMRDIQEKHPDFVGDVRGRGAMVAIELVKDPESKAPDKERTARVVEVALQGGLLLLTAGQYSNVIRTLMPLVITDDELEEGLSILGRAVDAAA
jgi:acetylornithine/N-succinyldiaminopimelate aminotransferase